MATRQLRSVGNKAAAKRQWQQGSGSCDEGEDDGGGVEANGDGGGVAWRRGSGDSKAVATAMRERHGDGNEGAATGQQWLRQERGQWGWCGGGGMSNKAATMAMEGGLGGIKAARRRVVR
jgi:hypothetical protein